MMDLNEKFWGELIKVVACQEVLKKANLPSKFCERCGRPFTVAQKVEEDVGSSKILFELNVGKGNE